MPNDERTTPRAFFDELDAEFRFTLDVAATPETALCVRYLSASTDALSVPWGPGERCWLNPPYSRGQIRKWLAHAARQPALVVALVPADTSTGWWHRYVWDESSHHPRTGVAVRFPRGRLAFGGGAPSAAPQAGAKFASAIVIFKGVTTRPDEVAQPDAAHDRRPAPRTDSAGAPSPPRPTARTPTQHASS